VHVLIYVVPICIKFQYVLSSQRAEIMACVLIYPLRYDPLFATFLLLGILALFKSYPTLSDPGLFLSMIAVFPEIYSCKRPPLLSLRYRPLTTIPPDLRHPIVTALLHLHSSLLMPLFHHLWLTQGTGNANFFYATTLVFAIANGAALIDCLWAGLRIAIGPDVDGYVVTQE
jgi:phosphatidylinositol glycan class U